MLFVSYLIQADDGTLIYVQNRGLAHAAPEVQARGGDRLYRGEKLPQATGIKPEFQNSGRWIAQPGT